MKKHLLMMGLVLGALTLTNCTNDINEGLEPDAQTKEFALTVAAGDNTRTTIDDFTTSWAAGDQINVFYAEPDTKKYVNSNNFTISAANLASNTFTGSVPAEFDEAANYDWYAVYPYNASLATPANSTATIVVGQTAQTQQGNNSTAHLCGANAPLVGKVSNANVPAITMNHLVAVMELNVTNASREAVTIQSIKVESEQNIAGEYAVYFGGDVVVYGDKGNASKSATLTVNGASALAAGSKAQYYLSVKPFTAKAGEIITFTITTDKGDIVISKPLTNDLTLNAGKVKKIGLQASTLMTTIVRDWTAESHGSWQVVVENKVSNNWTVQAVGDASWVDVWYDDNMNYFGAQPKKNPNAWERTAQFYVVDEDGSVLHLLIIKQAGLTPKMNQSDLEFLYALIKEGWLTYDDGSRFKIFRDYQPDTEAFSTCDFDGWIAGQSGIKVEKIDGISYITELSHPWGEVTPYGEDESVKKSIVLHGFPEKMHLPKLRRFHYDGYRMYDVELPKDWYTPELEHFNVAWSYMGGTIPEGLAATPKLKYLNAYNCDFYGALPHNWESDKLMCVNFGGNNADLGYMVPASLDVVTPENFVAYNYVNAPTFVFPRKYANWVGFENGWGQARCADDQTNTAEWYNNRMVNYAIKDGENKVNVNGESVNWGDTYNIDGWLPHVMNEWNQIEADAYTAQCKADRGLL